MAFTLKLFEIGLLVFLSINNILADKTATIKYEVKSVENIFFKGNRLDLNISHNLYIRPNPDHKDAFYVQITNPQISMRSNKQLEIMDCMSMNKVKVGFLIRFMAQYGADGRLKNIQVHEQEVTLATNLKMNIMSILQVNKAAIRKMEKLIKQSSEAKNKTLTYKNKFEIIFPGYCKADYFVAGKRNNFPDELFLKKVYNMSSCYSTNKDTERKCPGLKCLPRNENKLIRKHQGYISVNNNFKQKDAINLGTNLKMEKNIQFHAWEGSVLTLEGHTYITEVPIDEKFETKRILPIIPENSKIITHLLHRNLDTKLCQSSEAEDDDYLKEMYRALSCERDTNIYLEIIERALQCDTVMPS